MGETLWNHLWRDPIVGVPGLGLSLQIHSSLVHVFIHSSTHSYCVYHVCARHWENNREQNPAEFQSRWRVRLLPKAGESKDKLVLAGSMVLSRGSPKLFSFLIPFWFSSPFFLWPLVSFSVSVCLLVSQSLLSHDCAFVLFWSSSLHQRTIIWNLYTVCN